MNEPIKHAPGVLCMLSGFTVAMYKKMRPGHAPLPEGVPELLVKNRNGIVVTLVSIDTSKIRTVLARTAQVVWEVQTPRPLPAATRVYYSDGTSKHHAIVQRDTLLISQNLLIPIAGPGIDTSEPTSVSTTRPIGSIITDRIPTHY